MGFEGKGTKIFHKTGRVGIQTCTMFGRGMWQPDLLNVEPQISTYTTPVIFSELSLKQAILAAVRFTDCLEQDAYLNSLVYCF